MRQIQKDQSTAAKRRVYFQIEATGGSPALLETGGQPELSTNGTAWTTTGIGTLTSIGFGRYFADLTVGAVGTAGDILSTRYKSAATKETVGDSVHVIGFDPDADDLGLLIFPTAVNFALRSTRVTGEILSDSIVAFTKAAQTIVVSVDVRDENGALTPIDLSSKTVKFVVFNPDDEADIKFQVEGTVGGVNNNQVTITWTASDFPDDDVFHYVLRNTTDGGIVLAEGTFHVKRAAVAT